MTRARKRHEIPYPALTSLYYRLSKSTSADRLAEAEGMTVKAVADLFIDSAGAFDRWDVSESEPFFPEALERDLNKNPKSRRRTYGWAMAVKSTPSIRVQGDSSLDFRYAAREV